MAVNNTLVKKPTANETAITFTAGNDTVKLSPAIIKKYLVSGDANTVTDQELMMFMMMCKGNHLNPWNKEAYCIKYGTQPATMVIGKDAFMKRASGSTEYDGMTSGIVVINNETGEIEYRTGTIIIEESEKIIGGWAEVFRKDRTHSTRIEVSFNEYAGRKKDGTLNNQWATKPATMIRKVAQVQALREAFPESLSNLYTSEEQGIDEPTGTVIEQPVEIAAEQTPAPKAESAETESLF